MKSDITIWTDKELDEIKVVDLEYSNGEPVVRIEVNDSSSALKHISLYLSVEQTLKLGKDIEGLDVIKGEAKDAKHK